MGSHWRREWALITGKTRVAALPRERSDALAATGVGYDPISSRRRPDETQNDAHQPGNPADVGSPDDADEAMMARCIELSRIAVSKGEYPFGAVIARDGQIVAEAVNRTIREGDVTHHAEVIALSLAQKTIGREQLRNCTLYTTIEPCAMCSYCIREAWVSRVVYALGSPVMGGLSKWNILRDDGMSRCAGGGERCPLRRGPTGLARMEPLGLGDDQVSRIADRAVPAREPHPRAARA
jgi:tRNA(Arg) A34 adenosine deaminase TadA